MRPVTPDIGQLLDHHAIEQVLVHYFDRVDANDPAGAGEVFCPDVQVEIMTGKRYQGREAFTRALGRVLDQYASTSHHLSNVRCAVREDTAHASAYVYAFHRMADTGEPWHLWARVEDRLQRRPDGWMIVEHVLYGVDSVPARAAIPPEWYAGHPGRLGGLG